MYVRRCFVCTDLARGGKGSCNSFRQYQTRLKTNVADLYFFYNDRTTAVVEQSLLSGKFLEPKLRMAIAVVIW